MLEEYARPQLGDYDEDSGALELDFRKVLMYNNRKLKDQEMDNNKKLEDQEKAYELYGD